MFTPDREPVPRDCLLRVIYVSRSPTPTLRVAAVTLSGCDAPTPSPLEIVSSSGLRTGKECDCPQSHQLCWLNPMPAPKLAARPSA